MSCLGGEVVDEAMLLDAYDAHLQLAFKPLMPVQAAFLTAG
jgi:hypothetical protein